MDNMGGLIGEVVELVVNMININQCYSTGTIKSVSKVGGLIGICLKRKHN